MHSAGTHACAQHARQHDTHACTATRHRQRAAACTARTARTWQYSSQGAGAALVYSNAGGRPLPPAPPPNSAALATNSKPASFHAPSRPMMTLPGCRLQCASLASWCRKCSESARPARPYLASRGLSDAPARSSGAPGTSAKPGSSDTSTHTQARHAGMHAHVGMHGGVIRAAGGCSAAPHPDQAAWPGASRLDGAAGHRL